MPEYINPYGSVLIDQLPYIDEIENKAGHNCAIVGVYAPGRDVVGMTTIALQHLNHRGQEGAGEFVINPAGKSRIHRGSGLARDVFTSEVIKTLRADEPHIVLGQDRYSTAGIETAWQPIPTRDGSVALAHNGNLTNAQEIRKRLPLAIQSEVASDTDITVKRLDYLIEEHDGNVHAAFIQTVQECEGAYNFIAATADELLVFRDPLGYHPLVVGRMPPQNGKHDIESYIVASESSAFTPLQAETLREVMPGEAITINKEGVQTFFVDGRADPTEYARCLFEIFYFSSPDAIIFGKHVSEFRRTCGELIAQKDLNNRFMPDIIIPIQMSGELYGEGYAQEYQRQVVRNPGRFSISNADLPDRVAALHARHPLVANKYSRRVFIDPAEKFAATASKFRPDIEDIRGQRLVLIDDSIVRGPTAQIQIASLKYWGAKEVHFRSAFPPVRFPCYMGIDFPTQEELATYGLKRNEIQEGVRKRIGADSLSYLSEIEALTLLVGPERAEEVKRKSLRQSAAELYRHDGWCGSCLHGEYRQDIKGVFSKNF